VVTHVGADAGKTANVPQLARSVQAINVRIRER
jgi:hypothetical protein